MHVAASYKSRGFGRIRALRSSPSWSRAIAMSRAHKGDVPHFHMQLPKGSASSRCHSQVWRGHSATMCVAEPVLHLHFCLYHIDRAHQELRMSQGRTSSP